MDVVDEDEVADEEEALKQTDEDREVETIFKRSTDGMREKHDKFKRGTVQYSTVQYSVLHVDSVESCHFDTQYSVLVKCR